MERLTAMTTGNGDLRIVLDSAFIVADAVSIDGPSSIGWCPRTAWSIHQTSSTVGELRPNPNGCQRSSDGNGGFDAEDPIPQTELTCSTFQKQTHLRIGKATFGAYDKQ